MPWGLLFMVSPEFPIGVCRNPLVDSVFYGTNDNAVIAPGAPQYIITEDGIRLITEDGIQLITEG